MSVAFSQHPGMAIVELVALGVVWIGATALAGYWPGRLGWWATLASGIAGSTAVMHLPAVAGAGALMSSQDRHLVAVALALLVAIPAAMLWRRSRHRLLGQVEAPAQLRDPNPRTALARRQGVSTPSAAH